MINVTVEDYLSTSNEVAGVNDYQISVVVVADDPTKTAKTNSYINVMPTIVDEIRIVTG